MEALLPRLRSGASLKCVPKETLGTSNDDEDELPYPNRRSHVPMQGYDILMIIVLVAAVVWGAWKGFAWQIASLGSMIASYIVALTFRQQLAQYINASPPWNMFLSMLILFLGTSLVVWIGFNLVAEVIEKVKLKEFDRQIGAIFGLAKGVLLCVLITLFSVTLLSEPQRQAICNSKSGYYIAVLLDKADGVIPGELHQVLDPYIDRLDAQVPHEHTEGGFELPAGILSSRPEREDTSRRTFPRNGAGDIIEALPVPESLDLNLGGVKPRIFIQEEEEAKLGIEIEQ
ncbi:MAG: CvpA family protein [Planctomycetaceae bacterium]|nr:CvpA family protein [Planctomycetaceae bacterium]